MEKTGNYDTLAFHIQLLLQLVDIDAFPFTRLLIRHNISKDEYDELMQLIQQINEEFEQQRKEGLLNFLPLLVHFAGMLNEKLNPDEVIYALKKEGYYPSLLNTFIEIIENEKSE
ncbi:DUF1878 family protein [Oceanobacillus halotolerans]|uniref:DUF1878 family protein n=1 Tax=Oceanobacillus halotolerans TaxID=2663380 RepID=UPI0013DCF2BA|nr:DUF1878 family protein [Oceanobacillus halotolerans]